ncbi:hypothetical protein Tco_0972953 [Tanacetum coccineum]
MEVEPLDKLKLEDVGLDTCSHGLFLSSRGVPSVDEPEPQPLPNFPSLDVSLGDQRSPEPPIKPHCAYSFRMKEVDNLTIHILPSPHVAPFHPKDVYHHYYPCIDDPKKHYGFKPAFGKHLEEKHVTWAQFRKKRDKNTTLLVFDQAMVLQYVETVSGFHLTSSMFKGDDIIMFCDDVKAKEQEKKRCEADSTDTLHVGHKIEGIFTPLRETFSRALPPMEAMYHL